MKTLLILLISILLVACKKQSTKPNNTTNSSTSTPVIAPKGLLEGNWKYISGDSATINLVLTTYTANAKCYNCGNNYTYLDIYDINIKLFSNDGSGVYFQRIAGYNTDTLKLYNHNAKSFNYIRQ
jgi:hypothetical protein